MKNHDIHFDTNELRYRIMKQYGSIKAFAEAVEMNPQTLSGRLNGRTYFDLDEIDRIKKALNLDRNEIGIYFTTFENVKLKKLAALVDCMTDYEFDLLRQIMTMTSGRPDLREFAKGWTGKMQDLPSALAQI